MPRVTTTNLIRRQVTKVLEYLQDAELALYTNRVAETPKRVTWQCFANADSFPQWGEHASLDEYLRWVITGNYSAALRDGSLLQVTYDVQSGQVVGHRLAYVPCPVAIDQELVDEGHALADIVTLHERVADIVLRSPIRFDYDTGAAKPGHPVAHFTINSAECRIACAAPVHVGRFIDFVYRHFYPELWSAHLPFFAESAHLHIGGPTLTEDDRADMHLAWDARGACAAAGASPPSRRSR